jgi:hypothetical protein
MRLIVTGFLLFGGMTILDSGRFAAAAPIAAKLVTTAVGRVRDHVVTSREVQINNAIEQALSPAKASQIKILKDPDSASFSKQVTSVLLEWVVFYESRSMAVADVTGSEISEAQSRVKAKLGRAAAWKALGTSESEAQKFIVRKLQAKKFIRFRADSSVVPVSDSEAERYFEQNRLKFGDLPFENFRTNIKSFLARQQVERRLKDWFEVLQAKYQVRNFLAEL